MQAAFAILPKQKTNMQDFFFSILLSLLVSQTLFAQGHGPHNLNKAGVAIDGYDPVAYFKGSKARTIFFPIFKMRRSLKQQ
jgi:hypothetical protein